MASFVEQATLKVVDKSSAQIRRINAELKKLFATARSLRTVKVDISVRDRGIQSAIANLRRLRSELTAVRSASRNISLSVSTGQMTQAAGAVRRLNAELRTLRSASRAIDITANTSGLSSAQSKINALRNSARRPINVNVAGVGGGGGMVAGAAVGARRGRGGGTALTAHGVLAGPISITGAVTVLNIAALAHAIGRVTMAGARQADTADTRMALRGLPEGEVKQHEKAITELMTEEGQTKTKAVSNRAQIKEQYSEALTTTQGDVEMTKFLVRQLQSLKKSGMATGMSAEQANEEGIAYLKAGEMTGAFYDEEHKFNKERAAMYFDRQRQLKAIIGREQTGQNLLNLTRAAGSLKYGMNTKTMTYLALMGEEERTRAATGLNELEKDLSGIGLAGPQLQKQKELGLLSTKYSKWGKVGKGKKAKPIGQEKVDRVFNEKALRGDIIGYVAEDVRKAFEQREITPGVKYDLSNPEHAKKAASEIATGRSVATLVQLWTQQRVLEKQAEQVEKAPGTMEAVDPITAQSTQVRAAGARAQIEGVCGQLANKAEVITLPALEYVAEAARKTAEAINKGDWATATAEAAKGAALPLTVGAAGARIMAPLLNTMFGAAAPGLAVRAMASKDEGVSAMGGAAGALIGAASDLSGAAGALNAAAAAQSGKSLKELLGAASLIPGPVGLAARTALLTMQEPPPLMEMGPEEQRKFELLKAQQALAKQEQRLAELNLHEGMGVGKPARAAAAARIEQERAEIATSIANLTQAIARLSAPPAITQVPEPKPKEPEPKDAVETRAAMAKAKADAAEAARIRAKVEGIDPVKPVILPDKPIEVKPVGPSPLARGVGTTDVAPLAPKPVTLDTTKPIMVSPSAEWKPVLIPPAPPPGAAPPFTPPTTKPISDTGFDISQFTAAAATINSTPSLFSSAFGTGVATIPPAGQAAGVAAGMALAGAAPGIGGAIGAAAAAAIQAAVSNLNVNVNAAVKTTSQGADTGGQKGD